MKSQAREKLKTQLESRGLRLSSADVAALLEELSPKVSHAALGYAANLLRPFSAGMGLRITRLSDSQIEIVLPARTRNMSEQKRLHEAALLAAAIEGARLLWERHAPLGEFQLFARRSEVEILKPVGEDVRLRLELPEALRESVLAELRRQRQGQADVTVQAFDDGDSVVAEINLHLDMRHTPSLAAKKS